MNSAGPQWDSNKFNGRARRRARRGPKALSLGEQVVGVVGEERRPDRPVYMAREIRERLLPPSPSPAPLPPSSSQGREVSVGPKGHRVYAHIRRVRAHARARARTEDGGSEG